jgi:hypothetical protein
MRFTRARAAFTLHLLIVLIAVRPSLAAQPPCQAVHTIAAADTLASISLFYFADSGFAMAILKATNARAGTAPFTRIGAPAPLPLSRALCIPTLQEAERLRTLYDAYTRAVLDTMTPHPSDVSTTLDTIDPRAPAHVVSWFGSYELPAYQPEGRWTTTAPKDMWVTVTPYLKTFCQNFVNTHGSDSGALTLRLEQLIGLPPGAGQTHVMELTVKDPGNTAHIFRPCATSPATNVPTCAAGSPPASDAKHAAWIYRQYFNAFAMPTPDLYPWTALGYTFDWAARDTPPGAGSFVRFGGSEFVIPKGAPIEITGVSETMVYCRP